MRIFDLSLHCRFFYNRNRIGNQILSSLNLNPRLRLQYSTKAKDYYNNKNINKMSHNINTTIADQQADIFFGSEVLNRVSFLREDPDFVTQCIAHPSARFLIFNKCNPLVDKTATEKLQIFANGDNECKVIKSGLNKLDLWNSAVEKWIISNKEHSKDIRDKGRPIFVFLGLEDESVGLDIASLKMSEWDEQSKEMDNQVKVNQSTNFDCEEKFLDYQGKYQGIPYFAVDVTQAKELEELLISKVPNSTPETVFFSTSRKHYLGFNNKEAALYSHGKMYLDWLSRNLFCSGCGSKSVPIDGGAKLMCTNDEVTTRINSAGEEVEIYACPGKRQKVSNVYFPRTDAVIITAITNEDRLKILLSLSKRYEYTKMYSCTAGFMEPSETVEVATKREIWEETGVWCLKINIVLTQPWPFPANLMIGCLGVVDFNGKNENIHLGHDRELADARWFDTDLVRKWIYEGSNIDNNPEGIVLPSPESISFLLIKLAVDQHKEHKEKL